MKRDRPIISHEDFLNAVRNNDVQSVRWVMEEDASLNPADNDDEAIKSAQTLDMVDLLMRDPRVNRANIPIEWLPVASEEGRIDVVNAILAHVDMKRNRRFVRDAISAAVRNNRVDVVRRLMRLVDPIFVLELAVTFGNPQVARDVLSSRHDQAVVHRMARMALHNIDVLRVFLEDHHVDDVQGLFHTAVEQGNLPTVDFLLNDQRVDPSRNDNSALIAATYLGHADVVKRLLQDARVDPSARNQLAIREAVRRNHPHVANVLIQDPRTQWRYAAKFLNLDARSAPIRQRLFDVRAEVQAKNVSLPYSMGRQVIDNVVLHAGYAELCSDLQNDRVPSIDLYYLARILKVQPIPPEMTSRQLCDLLHERLHGMRWAQ